MMGKIGILTPRIWVLHRSYYTDVETCSCSYMFSHYQFLEKVRNLLVPSITSANICLYIYQNTRAK